MIAPIRPVNRRQRAQSALARARDAAAAALLENDDEARSPTVARWKSWMAVGWAVGCGGYYFFHLARSFFG